MRNNTNNPMAKIFGNEFNLSTKEVADCIERVYKMDISNDCFRFEDVDVALCNSDYYVRPGESKRAFKQEWMKVFIEANAIDDNEFKTFYIMFNTIKLIRKYFDEEYFQEQIARRQISTGDKIKLKTYMSKFNKTQLFRFMIAVRTTKSEKGMFISEASHVALFKEIDDECRRNGANIPIALNSPEGVELLRQHPFYYFEILSTKTISDLLCEAIDLDVNLATTIAGKLWNSGYEAMLNYLNEKLNIELVPVQVSFAK